MNRLHAAFGMLLLLLLGGCVSPGISLPKEMSGKLKEVYIVAMEPHPLGLPPGIRSMIVGSGGSLQMARGFTLLNTVAILFEIPEASKQGGELSRSYQAALDQKNAWVPTVVLANEAKGQLVGKGFQATVAPKVKLIPGVKDRAYTVLMENWLAPIRAWYNDTTPVTDYGDLLRDKSSYVLEVGVINYEIAPSGGLLVQVAMKVIDPSSGAVIGRARAGNPLNMPSLSPLDQAFLDDASRFKEAFLKTGQEITKRCLAELGLIQHTQE